MCSTLSICVSYSEHTVFCWCLMELVRESTTMIPRTQKSAVAMIHVILFAVSLSSFCLSATLPVAASSSKNRDYVRLRLDAFSSDKSRGPSTTSGTTDPSLAQDDISSSRLPKRFEPSAALFIFGDSLSDVGNHQYKPGGYYFSSYKYPNGIDYIPQSGRFGNGKVWVDWLGKCGTTSCLTP